MNCEICRKVIDTPHVRWGARRAHVDCALKAQRTEPAQAFDHMTDDMLAEYIFVHATALRGQMHETTYAILASAARRLKRAQQGPLAAGKDDE